MIRMDDEVEKLKSMTLEQEELELYLFRLERHKDQARRMFIFLSLLRTSNDWERKIIYLEEKMKEHYERHAFRSLLLSLQKKKIIELFETISYPKLVVKEGLCFEYFYTKLRLIIKDEEKEVKIDEGVESVEGCQEERPEPRTSNE